MLKYFCDKCEKEIKDGDIIKYKNSPKFTIIGIVTKNDKNGVDILYKNGHTTSLAEDIVRTLFDVVGHENGCLSFVLGTLEQYASKEVGE